MPFFISLPEIVEAEFHETGLDCLGGEKGIGRPGYEIRRKSLHGDELPPTHGRKERFEREHIRVPEGVDAAAMLAEILHFMEPKLAPFVPAGEHLSLNELDGH